jgi:hypothetical protein
VEVDCFVLVFLFGEYCFPFTAEQIGAMCCTVYGAGKQAKYRIIATVKNKVNSRLPSSKNGFTKIYLTVSLIPEVQSDFILKTHLMFTKEGGFVCSLTTNVLGFLMICIILQKI